MTRLASGPAVDVHCLGDEWIVLLAEEDSGVADVRQLDGIGEVFVADMPDVSHADGNSFASVRCLPGGEVQVSTRNAPPALLATSEGHRAVPSGVVPRESVVLSDGDRLILLSASALEGAPRCLARILHEPPDSVLRADPRALLAEVFDQQSSGAGAVIMRSVSAMRHQEVI